MPGERKSWMKAALEKSPKGKNAEKLRIYFGRAWKTRRCGHSDSCTAYFVDSDCSCERDED